MLQNVNPKAVSLDIHKKRPILNDVDTVISKYIEASSERGVLLTMRYIQQKATEIFNYLMDPKKNLYSKGGFRVNEGKGKIWHFNAFFAELEICQLAELSHP